jgi:molecular chaperone DnaK
MEQEVKDKNIYDFLPVTLSLETKGGISTPLIRRGTPLPTKRSQVFSTASDNQESVEIHVLLGERPFSKNNTSIGRCQLNEITRAPSGVPQIRVIFEVDTSCNVKVEASETDTDRKIETKFEKAQTILTKDLVQKLLLDAKKTRHEMTHN